MTPESTNLTDQPPPETAQPGCGEPAAPEAMLEGTVKAQARLLGDIVEALDDWLFTIDLAGVITFSNGAVARLLGYEDHDVIGRPLVMLAHPGDLELLHTMVARAISGHETRQRQSVRLNHRNGTSREKELTLSPMPDGASGGPGKVRALCGIVRADGERRRIERALRSSEQRFRWLLNEAPAAIIHCDPEGYCLFVNKRWCQITGLAAEEAAGHGWRTVMDEGDYARVIERLRRFENQPAPFELEFRLRGAPDRVCRGRGIQLLGEDGKPAGSIGVIEDLTRHKHFEEQVQSTERAYREIVENSTLGICRVTRSGRFLAANQALARMLGYDSPEQLITEVTDIASQLYVHPEKRADNLGRVQSQGGWGQFQNHYRRRDGRVILVDAKLHRVPGENPEDDVFEVFLEDITERQQAEQTMLEASRMQTAATLAGGVAHDFNNLMVGVLGNAELLRVDLSRRPELLPLIENIACSARQAGELAQQLLAFARGGKHQVRRVDVNELVEELLMLQEHSFPPRVQFERQPMPGLWPIEADPTQLKQVIMALCVNAAESIDAEGRVLISTHNFELTETQLPEHPDLKPGRYAALVVRDTGSGMPHEVRMRIFEPFFTTKFQGRGLGLAAVYGIVKNHGGSVQCDSEPGKGSTFTVLLPALPSEPAAAQEAEAVEALTVERSGLRQSNGGETILLVDDEPLVLNVSRSMLERAGYRVLAARSGDEALRLAREWPGTIALALVDIGMPRMGGEETLRRLLQLRPMLKIIVCSGYDAAQSATVLRAAGAHEFLQKPFSGSTLLPMIRKLLDQTQPG